MIHKIADVILQNRDRNGMDTHFRADSKTCHFTAAEKKYLCINSRPDFPNVFKCLVKWLMKTVTVSLKLTICPEYAPWSFSESSTMS